jgi:penicillin-insensitive murein endopeptidase
MSPKEADLHNDHFHVRIACPEAMRGACVEESRSREGGSDAAEIAEAGGPTAAEEQPEADTHGAGSGDEERAAADDPKRDGGPAASP